MKCSFEDMGEIEKIGLTLLHSESERIFKSIPHAKYRQKVLFLGLGRNDGLGYKIYVIYYKFDNLEALNL